MAEYNFNNNIQPTNFELYMKYCIAPVYKYDEDDRSDPNNIMIKVGKFLFYYKEIYEPTIDDINNAVKLFEGLYYYQIPMNPLLQHIIG